MSSGIELTTSTAFDDVQQMSVSAFTAAVVLTYETTTALGCWPFHARSCSALMESGRPVRRSGIRPGDLVFSYGGGHVGVYMGHGQVIHAPHTGDVVRVQDAFRSDYVGAGRP